ncbi:fructose-2,6-bisphosphatase TIGAR B-like [Sycon ciliatum]|uniref:fructose-2,6-bisphosphatase TIGAR B-like n=1 Tax=Sycon ciliatum TaxID=27933 RepID=UPI0031F6B393|eukprot:scpid84601/ scgid30285/ Probable fructose-2,6-bisphosphatase TIGAR; TP53-induced glycolysis and apoptosis regulator
METSYKLTLIRHGETNENRLGIMQGQMDCALSEVGEQQARALGSRLAADKMEFTHVFSSDLQRAYKTATISLELLAKQRQKDTTRTEGESSPGDSTPATHNGSSSSNDGVAKGAEQGPATTITRDQLLREFKYGTGEGKTRVQLNAVAQQLGMTLWEYTPPGAESELQMEARTSAFFDKLNSFVRDRCCSEDCAADEAALKFTSTPGLASGGGASAPPAQPHLAVYTHGGWIRVFLHVLARKHHLVSRVRGIPADRLSRVPPNTGVCQFTVRLGDGVTQSSARVECTMAHDAQHLDSIPPVE